MNDDTTKVVSSGTDAGIALEPVTKGIALKPVTKGIALKPVTKGIALKPVTALEPVAEGPPLLLPVERTAASPAENALDGDFDHYYYEPWPGSF